MFEGHETTAVASEQTERFTIDDQGKAEWALRKGAAIDAEITLLKTQYRARLSELEADKNAWERRFVPELKAWAEVEKERRRRQSVTTLAGTLAFRSVASHLAVADLDAALHHAEVEAADALKITATLDKSKYLELAEAAMQETGELWPGVETVEASETFAIRFPKGKEAEPGE